MPARTGVFSMTADCDFFRTWGAMAPGGSVLKDLSAVFFRGVNCVESTELRCGVELRSTDGNVWVDPEAMAYGES